jgi:hypothetical protein
VIPQPQGAYVKDCGKKCYQVNRKKLNIWQQEAAEEASIAVQYMRTQF